MTGREIREALEEAGVTPSKQMGQNFLSDPNLSRWIVDQLEAQPGDAVVEVGPGTGSFSGLLAGKVRKLILIEFDLRLVEWLRKRFANEPSVEIHHADGAQFDLRCLFKEGPVKFLGNLPYSAGGAIMKNFLSRPNPFTRVVLMLQKEVVDRLAASPGGKDYGLLSLRIQSEWRVKILRTIPPEALHPRPRIDSAVAVLTPRGTELPAFDARKFDELVRRGFAQRRKQMGKQMPEEPAWASVADEQGISLTARAEELPLERWIALARAYDPHPLKDIPQKDGEIFDVVDAEDRVIGQETRGEVHRRDLLHRAVHVFVVDRKGQLLIQKRSRFKDRHPGVWDSSVSGHLDAGEDYLPAAVRELEEEMGIPAEAGELERVAVIGPSEATGWEHVHLFLLRWSGVPKFPCAEVEAALWMDSDELDGWISRRPQDFASGFLQCWGAARGR